MRRLPGLLILITVLSVFSCKQKSTVSEPEPEEATYFEPEPVIRWGINIDSLDIVDGVIQIKQERRRLVAFCLMGRINVQVGEGLRSVFRQYFRGFPTRLEIFISHFASPK